MGIDKKDLDSHNLVRTFAIRSFIIMFILGVLLTLCTTAIIEDFMVQRAISNTAGAVQLTALHHVSSEDFKGDDIKNNQENLQTFFDMIHMPDIVRVKAFNKESVVIFSDQKLLLGEAFTENEELQAALSGEIVVELDRVLEDKAEHRYEKGFTGIMEIYVPLYGENDEIIGVAEIYQELGPIDRLINRTRTTIATIILAGLGLLYVALLGTVKNASRSMTESEVSLKKSNKLKDLFIDVMTHDVLNYIGVIKNMTEMLGETKNDPEEKEELQVIMRNADKTIGMIKDTATLAKLEEQTHLELNQMELGGMLKEAVNDVTPFAKTKKMKIKLDVQGKYNAIVNPLLYIAVINLLNNAVKYGQEGSEIGVGITYSGGKLKIYVSNIGEAINDEDKESIFNRYERVSKGPVKGSGLGLAIVKRIVDVHHGRAWVEDNPEGGTIFNIEIPK